MLKIYLEKVNFNKRNILIPALILIALMVLHSFKGLTQKQDEENVYSSDKLVIEKGEVLFQQNCATCHNFLQRGIGPDLAGVTTESSANWLVKFIRDPQEMIESGDPRAKMLFEEYKMPMPSFSYLNDDEIQSLLSFLNTKKKPRNIIEDTTNLGLELKDPIPMKIPKSGLTLDLEEVLTAPATSEKIALARINQMRVLPGKKDRVFIQDMRGILYELKDKKLNVVMDITKTFPDLIPVPGHASGFGSYAFHPEFYKNGLFYTTHTEKPYSKVADFAYSDSIPVTLQWVLSEWKIDDPTAAIFSGKNREIFRVDMPTQMHGVQEIIFNPLAKPNSLDYGLLYIGVGDGGSAEHGYAFLCNTNTRIWSSILRIDPSGNNSKNGQYGIPAINPFAKDNDPNTLGEIFATGLRNPNRISWTKDGKMLIGDIGLTKVEELNIGKEGANYGWPAREGTFLLNYKGKMNKVYSLPEDDYKNNYTYPVAQFDHDEGKAFSAGFVYTGIIPKLKDKYIFGDIVGGRVFFVENDQLKQGQQAPIKELDLKFNGEISTFRDVTKHSKSDLRFGIGLDDQLYIYTKTDGKIWLVKDCY